MEKRNCFKVGFVLKPHGLKGEVTVALDADFPPDTKSLESVFLEIGDDLVPYFIDSISRKGNKAYVKFEEVDSIEDAAGIAKKAMFLSLDRRAKAGRGEFYDDEVTGFRVEDETLGPLGLIQEVVHAGPNRLLMLIHEGREILIPVNSPFVKSLNKSKKTFTVHLPDGFLDI